MVFVTICHFCCRNGLPVRPNGRNIQVSPDGSLILNNVKPSDEGTYTCNAYTGIYSVSATAEVRVMKDTQQGGKQEVCLHISQHLPGVTLFLQTFCKSSLYGAMYSSRRVTWFMSRQNIYLEITFFLKTLTWVTGSLQNISSQDKLKCLKLRLKATFQNEKPNMGDLNRSKKKIPVFSIGNNKHL